MSRNKTITRDLSPVEAYSRWSSAATSRDDSFSYPKTIFYEKKQGERKITRIQVSESFAQREKELEVEHEV